MAQNDSFYPEPDAGDMPMRPQESPEGEDDHDEKGEEKSGLLPKDFFPDEPKVGDVCSVRITHVLDNEVEVEYEDEPESKSKGDDEGDDDPFSGERMKARGIEPEGY